MRSRLGSWGCHESSLTAVRWTSTTKGEVVGTELGMDQSQTVDGWASAILAKMVAVELKARVEMLVIDGLVVMALRVSDEPLRI